jgi:hypothetical protein
VFHYLFLIILVLLSGCGKDAESIGGGTTIIREELPPFVLPPDAFIINLVASRYYSPTASNNGMYEDAEAFKFILPSAIQVTSGNAGNHNAKLYFDDIECEYKGGASKSHPTTTPDFQAGLKYNFFVCLDANLNTVSLAPGNEVSLVNPKIELRIINGDNKAGTTAAIVTLQSYR